MNRILDLAFLLERIFSTKQESIENLNQPVVATALISHRKKIQLRYDSINHARLVKNNIG